MSSQKYQKPAMLLLTNFLSFRASPIVLDQSGVSFIEISYSFITVPNE
jgi:hypothetical protein